MRSFLLPRRLLVVSTSYHMRRAYCSYRGSDDVILNVLDYITAGTIVPVRHLSSLLPDDLLEHIDNEARNGLVGFLKSYPTHVFVNRLKDGTYTVRRMSEQTMSEEDALDVSERLHVAKPKAPEAPGSFVAALLPYMSATQFTAVTAVYSALPLELRKECKTYGGLGTVFQRFVGTLLAISRDKCHVAARGADGTLPDDPTVSQEWDDVVLSPEGNPDSPLLLAVLNAVAQQDFDLLQSKKLSPRINKVRLSPEEMLDILVEYVPTFPVKVGNISVRIPQEVKNKLHLMKNFDLPTFFRMPIFQNIFAIDVKRQNHPKVMLHPNVAHPKRGVCDALHRTPATLSVRVAMLRSELYQIPNGFDASTDTGSGDPPPVAINALEGGTLASFIASNARFFVTDETTRITSRRLGVDDPEVDDLSSLLQLSQATGCSRQRVIQTDSSNPFLDREFLAQFIFDALPEDDSISVVNICQRLPPEARMCLPEKPYVFFHQHQDKFTMWEPKGGRHTVQRADLGPAPDGELDSTMYSEKLFVKMLYLVLPPHGKVASSIPCSWTREARNYLKANFNGITDFVVKRPDLFRYEFVDNKEKMVIYRRFEMEDIDRLFPDL